MAIAQIDDTSFTKEVLEAKGLVLVDFWAEWCGPCKIMLPRLEEAAIELTSIVQVGKVNVDDCPQLAQTYEVSGIPTLLLFKDGQIVERNIGAIPKEAIVDLVRKHA